MQPENSLIALGFPSLAASEIYVPTAVLPLAERLAYLGIPTAQGRMIQRVRDGLEPDPIAALMSVGFPVPLAVALASQPGATISVSPLSALFPATITVSLTLPPGATAGEPTATYGGEPVELTGSGTAYTFEASAADELVIIWPWTDASGGEHVATRTVEIAEAPAAPEAPTVIFDPLVPTGVDSVAAWLVSEGATSYSLTIDGNTYTGDSPFALGVLSAGEYPWSATATGEGGESDPTTGTLTVAEPATAPAAFGTGDWSVSGSTPGLATVTVSDLPDDGGSPLLRLVRRYRLTGETDWTTETHDPFSPFDEAIAFALPPDDYDLQIAASNDVTEPALAGVNWSATKTVTVSAAGVLDQTAYFGASTASGAGGFMAVATDGSDVPLTSIVSGGDTSPAAQIVDGRLSFSGVGAPDEAVIRCAYDGGEVDITIATVASAKSVATPGQFYNALVIQKTAIAPMKVMMRPGLYDVNNGGSSSNGIFQTMTVPEVAKTTITGHPDQVSRPAFHKPLTTGYNSYWYSTSWLRLEGVDFVYLENMSQMITSGSTGGAINRTHDIELIDVKFLGPEVSESALLDPVEWPSGYSGLLGIGPKLNIAYNITLDGVIFENIWTAGDYSTDGRLVMKNISARNIYFDFIRVVAISDVDGDKAKVFDNIRAYNFFANYNEMEPTTGKLEPHPDFIQVLRDSATPYPLKYAVFRGLYGVIGNTRGDVVQAFQNNNRINRCLYHEVVVMNRGAIWGFNSEGANYVLINQSTLVGSSLAETTSVRFGSSELGTPAFGDMRVRKTYVGNMSGGSSIAVEMSDPSDPASVVMEDSYNPANTLSSTLLQGPAHPVNPAAVLLAARPIEGGYLDVNGIGAVDLAGEWRGTEIPPMCGLAPDLEAGGTSTLTITPKPSLYYDVEPDTWQYRHRGSTGMVWSAPVTVTDPTATVSGLGINDTQIMYRWLNSEGVPGVWSDYSVVVDGVTPSEAPEVELVSASIATISSASSYRNSVLWPTSGTADDEHEHIIFAVTRQMSGSSKTPATPHVQMVDHSSTLTDTISLGNVYSQTGGLLLRWMGAGTVTPTEDDRAVRHMVTDTGTWNARHGAVAVKIIDDYSDIVTAYEVNDSMATPGPITTSITCPAGSRLIAFAYATGGALAFDGVTQVGMVQDPDNANHRIYVGVMDDPASGTISVSVDGNAVGLYLVAVTAAA